jgi:hypothetical protein
MPSLHAVCALDADGGEENANEWGRWSTAVELEPYAPVVSPDADWAVSRHPAGPGRGEDGENGPALDSERKDSKQMTSNSLTFLLDSTYPL